MNDAVIIVDDTGREQQTRLADEIAPILDDDLDAEESHRLERQNVIRWSTYRAPWDRTFDAPPPDTWEVIEYLVEDIIGDSYEMQTKICLPGVPGDYNLKPMLLIEFSEPAVTVYKVIKIQFAYRRFRQDGTVSGYIPIGTEYAQYSAAGVSNLLRSVSIGIADTIEMHQGDYLQFYWQYSIMFNGASTAIFDKFYSRFVLEKITDHYTKQTCCEEI